MRSILFFLFFILVLNNITYSQPAFTNYGEIKVSQSPVDDSPPSIAVNNDGAVVVSFGKRMQAFDQSLSRYGSTYQSKSVIVNPFLVGGNDVVLLDRYDSTLQLSGVDASISIYKFKHFLNESLLDSVTVLITRNNYEDYIYPMEYEWSVPVNVRALNTGSRFYAFFNLYYEAESELPFTFVRNFHHLFFWNPMNHNLKTIFIPDYLEEVFNLDPVQYSGPLVQRTGISNALLSDFKKEKTIFYRRIQKRTRYYISNPLKYLRTVKLFDANGDSLSPIITVDSIDASLCDLSERIILGDSDSFFIMSAKYPTDTLFVEQFDHNGNPVGISKPILNGVRFFIDLKSHRKSVAKLDTIPRLRKADYQIIGLHDGRFVFVWSHQNSDSTTGIFCGLLDANMKWLGPPKRINSVTAGNQYSPSVAVKGDTVYVVWLDTRNGEDHVYMRRFQADQITDVKNVAPQPTQFAIQEIFPNPFRESTTINFSLSHWERVGVRVYDILGREVKTLFNDEAESGLHTVQFNALHLPNGVYQVVLQTGKNVDRKNIVVMR